LALPPPGVVDELRRGVADREQVARRQHALRRKERDDVAVGVAAAEVEEVDALARPGSRLALRRW
jgi:hypothetical protein